MSPRSILVNARKSAPSSQLTLGGNRIRTIGPAEKETAVERGPAADHRPLARRPVLDPIQLIGPASLVGNSRETFDKSGTGTLDVFLCGLELRPRRVRKLSVPLALGDVSLKPTASTPSC